MAAEPHVSQPKQGKAGKGKKPFRRPNERRWGPKKKNFVSELDKIKLIQGNYAKIDIANATSFAEMPLSDKTKKGLQENAFATPTEIQRASLAHSLHGRDVLGAAKTGSGKTLAFVIPVMERLFCERWTRLDGLGALVVTPTRELAFQIFETLRKVGQHHDFSAGLIIGGKDLKFESKRMDQCNIVVGTPGRILQHMDENPLFDCTSMKILVLDEADRCLDMGFERTMNAIVENLPAERQTLLFSATQTKSVKDLARLSLREPQYVAVHEHAKHATPEGLRQSFVVCELHDKMAVLWSFLRHHKRSKVLVFLSSCKQVKYTYEVLCRLRPGVSLMALYGSLHQMRRMAVYEEFCKKQHAVLFATDIAARGLDFPAVDWVLQLDCPEDVDTYIHRAGRTARYSSSGEALLVLVPSEEKSMLEHLEKRKVPIERIQVNPRKLQAPQRALEACLARDAELKATAQRAFVSYFKAVFLMKDKDVFDVTALDSAEYARSLGLAVPPRIRFLERKKKAGQLNQTQTKSEEASEEEESEEEAEEENPQPQQSYDFKSNLSDSEDDVLTLKRKDHALEGAPDAEGSEEELERREKSCKKSITKVAAAKKILKKKIVSNKKTVFDEEGEVVRDASKEKVSEAGQKYEEGAESGGIDIEEAKQTLREEDKFDKQRFKARLKARKREAKLKLKMKKLEERQESDEDEQEVVLGGGDSEEDDGEGPDLSWLPDPDKIYGKEGEEASENKAEESDEQPSEESEESEESEVEEPPPKRRKSSNKLTEGLSLEDNEAIAMQFLKSRR